MGGLSCLTGFIVGELSVVTVQLNESEVAVAAVDPCVCVYVCVCSFLE